MYIGRTKHLTPKAQDYVRVASAILNQSIEDQGWRLTHKGIWLYVDLAFYMPDQRIRDSHNTIKLLLDIMQGRVLQNDMYALPRIQAVDFDKDNPRLEICITHQTHSQKKKGQLMVK